MPPVVIDLCRPDDQPEAARRIATALREGYVVAVPTETVYGLAALAHDERAVARLLDIKGRPAGNPLTLAISSGDEAANYCPEISVVGQRLARRCWPGPLTVVLDGRHPRSRVQELPASVRQAVAPAGTVGLRVPHHRVLLDAFELLDAPVVLSSANRSGEKEAVSADEVLAALGDRIELVIGDGRCKYGLPSTVVRVVGSRVEILRPGVLSEAALRRYASLIVLLVCTGNTCRSPMAAALLQDRLARQLNCTPGELQDRGVMVLSAGVAATSGAAASAEAVQAMAERGLDLTHHESRILTDVLVRFADLVLTMTHSHREAILAQWPETAARTALLCSDGSEVCDPMGGTVETYRRCADQMDAQLAEWAARLTRECVPSIGPAAAE